MRRRRFSGVRIACLLLVALTIASSYTIAKYVSSMRGSSANGVAKWSVDATSNSSSTMNLVFGNDTGSYTLSITSTSEVSAGYSVVLSGVLSGMEAKIDSGSYQTADNSGNITFNNVGSFAASDVNSTHTHTVTFNAPLGSNIQSASGIDINVVFVQAD